MSRAKGAITGYPLPSEFVEGQVVKYLSGELVPATDETAEGAGVLISGTGAPSSGVGVDGAYYIDTNSGLIWGPKAAGAWPANPMRNAGAKIWSRSQGVIDGITSDQSSAINAMLQAFDAVEFSSSQAYYAKNLETQLISIVDGNNSYVQIPSGTAQPNYALEQGPWTCGLSVDNNGAGSGPAAQAADYLIWQNFAVRGLGGTPTKVVQSITKANPGVVTTTTDHGWDGYNVVRFYSLVGMTELKFGYYRFVKLSNNTFKLQDYDTGVDVDTTTFSDFVSGNCHVEPYRQIGFSTTDNKEVPGVRTGGTSRTLSSVTNADPGLFTTTVSHGIGGNTYVWFTSMVGLTELTSAYQAVAVNATQFNIRDKDGLVDTTAMGTFVSGNAVIGGNPYNLPGHARVRWYNLSTSNLFIGFHIYGVNYGRFKDLNTVNCRIGILLDGDWAEGSSTDHSYTGGTFVDNYLGGDGQGIHFLVSQSGSNLANLPPAAPSGGNIAPTNNITIRDREFNKAFTHFAQVSFAAQEGYGRGPSIRIQQVGSEYLAGNAGGSIQPGYTSIEEWWSHAYFPFNYFDKDPTPYYGPIVTKKIKSALVYCEDGKVEIEDWRVSDSGAYVLVCLDGPNAEVHWKNAGGGDGSKSRFICRALHPDAKFYVTGRLNGYGRVQNLVTWPEGWTWFAAGGSFKSTNIAGSPGTLRDNDFPSYLHASHDVIAPEFTANNITPTANTTAALTTVDKIINGDTVRKISFSASQWTNPARTSADDWTRQGALSGRQFFESQWLRGYSAGSWPEGGSTSASPAISILVYATTDVTIGWAGGNGDASATGAPSSGLQFLKANSVYRLVHITGSKNGDSKLEWWVEDNPGVAWDIYWTRLSHICVFDRLNDFGIGDRWLQYGIWKEV